MASGKPGPIRLTSINIKGLNTSEKCSLVLSSLKHMQAHYCFLQEIHFCAEKIPKFHDCSFPTTYHGCSPDSKSKGVCILIRNLTSWSFWDQWCEAEGHALFIKGMVGDSMVTLANLYLPNSNQITFLDTVLAKLSMVIVGGDMNFTMDPARDASSNASHMSYAALKHLKKRSGRVAHS